MKKIIIWSVVILLLIAISPAVKEYYTFKSTSGNEVTVQIPEGSTSADIAKILKENGLIKYETAFKLKVRLSEYNNKLRYGTFNLNTGMCMRDIIAELGGGGTSGDVVFTVPEGFSAENIAARAEKSEICTREEFIKALGDSYEYSFIRQIPNETYKYKLQGFLFPSTYRFKKNTPAHEVINTMLGEFEKQYRNVSDGGDDIFAVVTTASLVEREARLDSERATIAGVIKNRLNNGMLLQIDATVVYAVTDGNYDKTSVTYSDLKTESPYNTYLHKGLPAGPICNPGIKSIEAALKPQSHDYLYYHTDESKKDGSHIFTQNYEQHTSTMQ